VIKSIRLINFRSYEDTTIECVPGINGIWGSSRAGKSNILRALRWVVFNRPSGDGFRSRFAKDKDTIVRVTFADGRWVERVKGSINAYRLGGNGVPTQEFKAMGLKVPEEISALINMTEVNLQAQMDQPFMVSMGAPELAKHLNQYANLSVIDNSLSFWRKKIFQNNSQKTRIAAQLKSNETELEQFQNVEELDGSLAHAEALEKNIQSKKAKAQRLNTLISLIGSQEKEIGQNKKRVEKAKVLLWAILDLQQRIEVKDKKANKLYSIIRTVQQVQKTTVQLSPVLERQSELIQIEEQFKKTLKSMEKAARLLSLVTAIRWQQTHIESLEAKKEAALNEYKENLPEQCPVCLQSWPEEEMEEH